MCGDGCSARTYSLGWVGPPPDAFHVLVWQQEYLPDPALRRAQPLHTTCSLLNVSRPAVALQMTTTAPWRQGILDGIRQRTLNSGAAFFPQAAPTLPGTHSIEPAWGVQRDMP